MDVFIFADFGTRRDMGRGYVVGDQGISLSDVDILHGGGRRVVLFGKTRGDRHGACLQGVGTDGSAGQMSV